MPTFDYYAIRVDDDEEKSFMGGVVRARTRWEAEEKLREKGLKPTSLKRTKGLMALLKWFDADIT